MLIQELIEDFDGILSATKNNAPRDAQFSVSENIIKVAIGMRRSGKTHFLYQFIRGLLSQGISKEQILYINFEDDRLLPLDHKGMGALLDDFYTAYPENHSRQCYLFLDEVQNVENWPIVVRRFFDTKKAQLYITGSSAKLLSKEIATSLRGRSLAVEILPYSFKEFLVARDADLPKDRGGKRTIDKLKQQFRLYLEIGGFPGVQLMPNNERIETLQGYVETVILKDIVERYGISNVRLLRYLIKSLVKNIGAPFSVNKFYNDIKSQGYKVGKDTIHSYLDYVEDAFLVFTVPIYSESVRISSNIPKKIYTIDNGLVRASTFEMNDCLGRLFENQIYLDLRRQGYKIFHYKTKKGFEIDFVTEDLKGNRELIQVVWDKTDQATLARETRALKDAEQELGIPGRLVDLESYLSDFALG